MRSGKRSIRGIIDASRHLENPRLLVGISLALIIATVLIMSVNPGAERNNKLMLSNAMLSGKSELKIDSSELASRIVEQKFQIHMEEMDQGMGEIPYVEVWVLNDPFYPLMGKVADLRNTTGGLASKEWQMLGFPKYDNTAGTGTGTGTTTGTTTTTTTSSAFSATATTAERAVMVSEIYELRGIRYTTIKVNDRAYDKLKAGSEFGDVFKIGRASCRERV